MQSGGGAHIPLVALVELGGGVGAVFLLEQHDAVEFENLAELGQCFAQNLLELPRQENLLADAGKQGQNFGLAASQRGRVLPHLSIFNHLAQGFAPVAVVKRDEVTTGQLGNGYFPLGEHNGGAIGRHEANILGHMVGVGPPQADRNDGRVGLAGCLFADGRKFGQTRYLHPLCFGQELMQVGGEIRVGRSGVMEQPN